MGSILWGLWKSSNEGKSCFIYPFTRRGISVILLLVGGDKSSPDRDLKRAKQLANFLRIASQRRGASHAPFSNMGQIRKNW